MNRQKYDSQVKRCGGEVEVYYVFQSFRRELEIGNI